MLYKISLPIAMLLGIFIAHSCDNPASSTEKNDLEIIHVDKERNVICYGRVYRRDVFSCVYVGSRI